MTQKRFVIRAEGVSSSEFAAPASKEFETTRGTVAFDYQILQGGPSSSVELLRLRSERAEVTIVPSRGMAIHKATARDMEFGWRSPNAGPVHPGLVPIWDPSGLGWLEGFDELLVRCGLESNGAPDFDDAGRLAYPLHGRVGNLPAAELEILVDEDEGWIEAVGIVVESRLFFKRLQLTSLTRVYADRNVVEVRDAVSNRSSQVATTQMLYHINVGRPLLDAGSELSLPARELAPRDAHAAAGLGHWSHYAEPEAGYQEQVYFSQLYADASGWSRALLKNHDKDAGLGVAFGSGTLPYFVQWKCTQADEDGYVTGLEPATNLPNPHSFEVEQGRVVTLQPNQSVAFQVNLHLLSNEQEVSDFQESVDVLADELELHREPKAGWSPA